MHSGIDFSAPKGTPIQATGAGKVVKAENEGNGYGLCVTIEHGYGYQTLYAHMSRIDVKVGQKVVRGQAIGLVGSSGASTAPHCHYEVMLRGNKVNPIHYVMDGLSPQEYQSLVKGSQLASQSFDYSSRRKPRKRQGRTIGSCLFSLMKWIWRAEVKTIVEKKLAAVLHLSHF